MKTKIILLVVAALALANVTAQAGWGVSLRVCVPIGCSDPYACQPVVMPPPTPVVFVPVLVPVLVPVPAQVVVVQQVVQPQPVYRQFQTVDPYAGVSANLSFGGGGGRNVTYGPGVGQVNEPYRSSQRFSYKSVTKIKTVIRN